MARARQLSPKYFKDYELAQLEPLARIAFQGLWVLADCKGRLKDKPHEIKAEVMPFDDVDMARVLDRLAEPLPERDHGFIRRYEVDGRRYIQVENFEKYQTNIHPNEKKAYAKQVKEGSALPGPEGTPNESVTEKTELVAINRDETPSARVSVALGPSEHLWDPLGPSEHFRVGNSDAGSAPIGSHPRHQREASDLVWFEPDDTLGWSDGIDVELANRFPERTAQLERSGKSWEGELSSLSEWHASAPKSKRKRISAQRWLFGRLFRGAEKKAAHANQHRPRPKGAELVESETRAQLAGRRDDEAEKRKRIEACEVDHRRDFKSTGNGVARYCNKCGWMEYVESVREQIESGEAHSPLVGGA